MRVPSCLLVCTSAFLIGACGPKDIPSPAATLTCLDGTTIAVTELTERIDALTRAANVHGLTVTIFNDAEKVYTRAFGVASLPAGKPLRTDTEIYGASLSKAVFSVLVMKLVEHGVLDLDKPRGKARDARTRDPRNLRLRTFVDFVVAGATTR